MTKQSSKEYMKDPFDLLQTITPATIDAKVYDTIVEKIALTKPIISTQRLHRAAAIFICLVGIEGYVIFSETSGVTNDFSDLITQTNNTLYYE